MREEIRAAVVAHPDRIDRAYGVREGLSQWCDRVLVDRQGYGCTDNHLMAWEELAREPSDWSLVVEDDAILHATVATQIPLALANAPTPIVSLYLGQGRPPHWQTKAARAVATNHPYIVCTSLLHCVAVAIRTDFLEGPRGMLEHVSAEAHGPTQTVIDEAITHWCKAEAIPVAYLNPSLVDHDASLPSVAVHQYDSADPVPRVAHWFGARNDRMKWYSHPFAIM